MNIPESSVEPVVPTLPLGPTESVLSEHLFEGDLPEERGESLNMIATGKEWLV